MPFSIPYNTYPDCWDRSYSTLTHLTKGQLILKADWRAIDSPKKRTDEFVLFAFLLFTVNKKKSSVCILEESTARQSAFKIN